MNDSANLKQEERYFQLTINQKFCGTKNKKQGFFPRKRC